MADKINNIDPGTVESSSAIIFFLLLALPGLVLVAMANSLVTGVRSEKGQQPALFHPVAAPRRTRARANMQ